MNPQYPPVFYNLSERNHPQYAILKKNIERSVQDMFLASLRRKSKDLVYVFGSEEQIDVFVKRMLDYWGKLEKYEICKEILDLSKAFKEQWKARDVENPETGFIKIKDVFNPKDQQPE